jgi:hypothetical protein
MLDPIAIVKFIGGVFTAQSQQSSVMSRQSKISARSCNSGPNANARRAPHTSHSAVPALPSRRAQTTPLLLAR